MSRTRSTYGANQPFSHIALPGDLLQNLEDQLRSLGEVLTAMDFLESQIDPQMMSGRPMVEIDRGQLCTMLRLLNGLFFERLSAAQELIGAAAT